MVLYSSAPVQQLVGVAFVDRVEKKDTEGLWALSQKYGGGLDREELEGYFHGKSYAFGVLISSVKIAPVPIDPKKIFPAFKPPQSYQYLSPEDFSRVMKCLFSGDK